MWEPDLPNQLGNLTRLSLIDIDNNDFEAGEFDTSTPLSPSLSLFILFFFALF
jgi:hypothetical protein